jgi:hypothetical protein
MLTKYLQDMRNASGGSPFWACAEVTLDELFDLNDKQIAKHLRMYKSNPLNKWEDDGGAVWLTTEGLTCLVKSITMPDGKLAAFLTALEALS